MISLVRTRRSGKRLDRISILSLQCLARDYYVQLKIGLLRRAKALLAMTGNQLKSENTSPLSSSSQVLARLNEASSAAVNVAAAMGKAIG